jgi:Lar family restriction alleviation protein
MTGQLLNCPFCGADADPDIADTGVFWARCKTCAAEGSCHDSEAAAIEAWNTRAPQVVDHAPTRLDHIPDISNMVADEWRCDFTGKVVTPEDDNLGHVLCNCCGHSAARRLAKALAGVTLPSTATTGEAVALANTIQRRDDDMRVAKDRGHIQRVHRHEMPLVLMALRAYQSPPPGSASHNSGERLPSSDAATRGGDTVPPSDAMTDDPLAQDRAHELADEIMSQDLMWMTSGFFLSDDDSIMISDALRATRPSPAPAAVEALRPLAKIGLWQDQYPDGPDIISNYRLQGYFTPEQIRAARAALAASRNHREAPQPDTDPLFDIEEGFDAGEWNNLPVKNGEGK